MNQVIRQKIPACVRTLLADIGMRDEHRRWREEEEPEAVTVDRDGVALPRRGARNPGELLVPAGELEKGEEGNRGRTCGLCLSQPLRYTCPRCNVPYCSLACYQSPAHSDCSEEFYKESVFQELRRTGNADGEMRRRMQEILLRLRETGEMEGVLGEEGAEGNGQLLELLSRLAETQESGARDQGEMEDILAKLKEIGLKHAEGGRGEEMAEGVGDLEEVSGEEEEDLTERLSGLDIDSLSEEQLWALLPQRDKERFEGLVKGGAISGLVPLWRPWWEKHEEGEGPLMEMLGDTREGTEQSAKLHQEGGTSAEDHERSRTIEVVKTDAEENKRSTTRGENEDGGALLCVGERENLQVLKAEKAPVNNMFDVGMGRDGEREGEKGRTSLTGHGHKKKKSKKPNVGKGLKSLNSVPPVDPDIPPLQSLSSQVSPLLCYSLVNALFGYTFSLCLLNGDLSEPDLVQEFCQVVLSVSESLGTSRGFRSLPEALEAGVTAARVAGHVDHQDPGASHRTMTAVAHVLTGKSRQDGVGYCLAALSQLRGVFTQARGALPRGGDGAGTRRQYFLAEKKLEFLQSWVKQNGPAVKAMAVGVWRELGRREEEREVLEKEKKAVECSWKKGRGRKTGVLIEEVD